MPCICSVLDFLPLERLIHIQEACSYLWICHMLGFGWGYEEWWWKLQVCTGGGVELKLDLDCHPVGLELNHAGHDLGLRIELDLTVPTTFCSTSTWD